MLILAALHTTPAHAQTDCRGYVDLARKVGWPKSERANLARIMERESRCYPGAWNQADPHGGSMGLLQINGANVGWATRNGWINSRTDLFHPSTNLKVGLELWKRYGWKPWGTRSSITPTKESPNK